MAGSRSVDELLYALVQDLVAAGFQEYEPEVDPTEIIAVFCAHRRVIRILLSICED